MAFSKSFDFVRNSNEICTGISNYSITDQNMFGNMMEQLQQMKQKMEESKQRLEKISVEGIASSGKVKITMNGNRKVTAVDISASLQETEKEELEDLLIIAINNALEQVEKVNEAEMQSTAMGIMPGLGL
jgi:nucleoid-associated protein EbfC